MICMGITRKLIIIKKEVIKMDMYQKEKKLDKEKKKIMIVQKVFHQSELTGKERLI